MVLALLALLFVGSHAAETKRLAMYWENWGGFPPASQVQNYTHVIIGFMTSYNTKCSISGIDSSQVSYFKNLGKKVIGSFGGWDQNPWWRYCDSATAANSLIQIVKSTGMDGVDIDYEVSPVNSSFLIDLTQRLANGLPGYYITHAPMNSWLDGSSSPYWPVVQSVGNLISFLNVQYYNNDPNPVSNPSGAIAHYKNIVNSLYGGNADHVVFGFCISECSSYNEPGNGAANIATQLVNAYPTSFGGVMAWSLNQDTNGQWSAPVHSALA